VGARTTRGGGRIHDLNRETTERNASATRLIVQPTTRDALLAGASGTALLALLTLTASLSLLARPETAAAGVGAALLVEALFVADTRAVELWERRSVRLVSVAVLVAGSILAAGVAGQWLVAATCWGLATYFVLLGLLVSGVWDPSDH